MLLSSKSCVSRRKKLYQGKLLRRPGGYTEEFRVRGQGGRITDRRYVTSPEVLYGYALEYEEKDKEYAIELGEDNDGPKDNAVRLGDSESQHKQTDASFEGHIGNDVDWLVNHPVLCKQSRQLLRQSHRASLY